MQRQGERKGQDSIFAMFAYISTMSKAFDFCIPTRGTKVPHTPDCGQKGRRCPARKRPPTEAALYIFDPRYQHGSHDHRENHDHPILEREAKKRELLYQPVVHAISSTDYLMSAGPRQRCV
jgi:hypothetical protein